MIRTLLFGALLCACISIPASAQTVRLDNDGRGIAVGSSPASNPAGKRQHRQVARLDVRHSRRVSRVHGPEQGSAAVGSSDVVSEARRYIGGNPTGRGSLWCAAFMNLVLQRTGHRVTGSNMARSFASYGQRVTGPQVGAIAVMSRRGGGHVGVVSGLDAKGNVIVISGNHGHRVAESVYPRSRIYAYVLPST